MFRDFLTIYEGPMGPVHASDIGQAFGLMGKGMVGIFIVMLLIYVVILILNRTRKIVSK